MEAPFLRQRGSRPADLRLGPRRGPALAPARPLALGDRPTQRRAITQEISYCIAYCPAETTMDDLVRVAGSRWAIEGCFQTAKQECGLDDYQVRRYPGWHRHMTLAMAVHACLTVLRARQQLDTGKAETDSPSSSRSRAAVRDRAGSLRLIMCCQPNGGYARTLSVLVARDWAERNTGGWDRSIRRRCGRSTEETRPSRSDMGEGAVPTYHPVRDMPGTSLRGGRGGRGSCGRTSPGPRWTVGRLHAGRAGPVDELRCGLSADEDIQGIDVGHGEGCLGCGRVEGSRGVRLATWPVTERLP
ncbi:hypothetical protein DWB77_00377 [Streptomyces hundungensis]|uniref:Transposase IS4-like domain-containing protein n=1 Tax=Streptomyces hundungensis TaxID=1077946 RepID=A0A387HBC9_9ACTN|nr:hypothetical protein DWB77_00377 [Streptomyces hundungensis]